MVTRTALAVALALAGCQSHDREVAPRVETGGGAAAMASGSDLGGGTATSAAALGSGSAYDESDMPEADKRPKRDEPEPVDPGKQLAELGAVPAWQAVVDRTRYLARRGQRGVVYGTLGDAIQAGSDGSAGSGSAGSVASTYTWLVDDTEGNGALAIRAQLDAPGKPGDRVALAGAWALDDARRWYWQVASATALPPAPASTLKEPRAQPGHAIATGDLPAGVRPISKARENDVVYFTLAGPAPVLDGDGWPVTDELGNPVAAILNLPGEHASYGAQDLRTADERWTLRRGQTYWVHVGVVHDHGRDKPLTMNARTAPVRVQ